MRRLISGMVCFFGVLSFLFSNAFAEGTKPAGSSSPQAIEAVITPPSDAAVKEEAMRLLAGEMLQHLVLNPHDTDTIYRDGCNSEGVVKEECHFYSQVRTLGGCGAGKVSASEEEACLKRGLPKIFFFNDYDFLAFQKEGDKLFYSLRFYYFKDGNHIVKNQGKEVTEVRLKEKDRHLYITRFPVHEMSAKDHYQKAIYFSKLGNIESAIESAAIAVNMDKQNTAYRQRMRAFMEEYFREKNPDYDIEKALHNLTQGFSPFYAQGEIAEKNYLRNPYNKKNVSEPVKGLLLWGSLPYSDEQAIRATEIELFRFKFGNHSLLPENKPRQPDFNKGR